MDSSLATSTKVLSKSTSLTWVYPCATNLALFLTMLPNLSVLFLKTYLVPMNFMWLGDAEQKGDCVRGGLRPLKMS